MHSMFWRLTTIGLRFQQCLFGISFTFWRHIYRSCIRFTVRYFISLEFSILSCRNEILPCPLFTRPLLNSLIESNRSQKYKAICNYVVYSECDIHIFCVVLTNYMEKGRISSNCQINILWEWKARLFHFGCWLPFLHSHFNNFPKYFHRIILYCGNMENYFLLSGIIFFPINSTSYEHYNIKYRKWIRENEADRGR